jgi:hypothetical protein
MRVLRKMLVVLITLGLPEFATGRPAIAVPQQPTPDLLERPVSDLDMTPRSTPDTFFRALQSARVPGGAIILFSCDQLPLTTVPVVAGTPLREVLDALVRADPTNRWELDNGVVNLIPKAGDPSLLTTVIPHFQAKGLMSVDAGIGVIEQLPEVEHAMAESGITHGIRFVAGPINPKPPPPFDVTCDGLTLRAVLNEIVRRAGGTETWRYIGVHCESRNDMVITS